MAAPELIHRVTLLERRVAELEAKVGASPRPATPATQPVFEPGALRATVTTRPAAPALETRVGLTWFNRAGAMAIVVALGLAAAWANEHGYLTPSMREAGGALLALAGLAAGLRLMTRGRDGGRRFGTGIAMLGAGALFLVPITASRIDHMLHSDLATALCVLVAVAIAAAADRARSPALAAVALAAAMLAPLASTSSGEHFGGLFLYLAAAGAGAVWLQRRRGWQLLDAGVVAAASIYYVFWIARAPVGDLAALVAGAGLWGLPLAYERWCRGRGRGRRAPDRRNQVVLLARVPEHRNLVLLLAALVGGAGVLIAAPGLTGGAVVTTLFALTAWVWRPPDRPRSPELLVTAAVLAAYLAPSALVASAPAAFVFHRPRRAVGLWAAGGFAAAWWCAAGAGLGFTAAAVAAALLAGVLAGAAGLDARAGREARSDRLALAGGLAVAAAGFGLEALGLSGAAFSLWGSLALVVVGVALVTAGIAGSFGSCRAVGLGLLALALGKGLAFDVWMLEAGPRIGAFLFLGAGLLVASFVYARRADRDRAGQT